ncbi:MAG: preprotein translocase subunit YajC [Deltaproteobacteria bacterium]|nr:preprotein translocase subunit YajC [Deltaproteobacteria bacterium]
MDLFIGTAWAQAGGGAPAGGGASMLVMFGMVFAIMYFLMIRPQNKRMQAHAAMVAALKKGDELVTVGGLHGRIASVEEKAVVVEIAKGIKITVDKDKVSRIGADSAPVESK